MNIKGLKYLAAFTIPTFTFIGVWFGGYYTYLGIIYSFCIVPLLDFLLPEDSSNIKDSEVKDVVSKKLYDWLLYLNIPVVYGLLFYVGEKIPQFDIVETIGASISLGIVIGANGINVAHELGHRFNWIDQNASKLLLIPALYSHFTIEHNRGHHRYVATPKDPSTASKGQSIFSFWVKSTIGCYLWAWKLENKHLELTQKSWYKSKMITNTLLEFGYIMLLIYFFGVNSVILIFSGIVGFLLLETINYIEHYGLLREEVSNGVFEKQLPKHSWNSNHKFGRMALYELTRHSDHHYRASKKYQILNHHDDSPQLPFGYPTAMMVAMIPPLWFKIMDKRLP